MIGLNPERSSWSDHSKSLRDIQLSTGLVAQASNNAVARQPRLLHYHQTTFSLAVMSDDTHAVSPAAQAVKDIAFGSVRSHLFKD